VLTRSSVPGKARAGMRGAGPRFGERVGIIQELAHRPRQTLDVTRRDDPACAERTDHLAEAAHVVDNCGHASSNGPEESARLVEFGRVREHCDRGGPERLGDLVLVQVPETPFGALACCGAERVERDAWISGDEETGSRDAENGFDGVRKALIRPDHPEREDRPTVILPGRIALEYRMGDHTKLRGRDAERGKRTATTLAVRDDPVEVAKQPAPGPCAVGRSTG
jgi:hypothetical protein